MTDPRNPSGFYGSTISGGDQTTPNYTSNEDSILYTGGGDSQNLQPYITCYMWKRVS